MSAEILRRAADAMRESAEIAASQPPTDADVRGVWLNSRYHVVLTTPAALAVADWLDFMAWQRETFQSNMSGFLTDHEARALAVARTYLGEDGARCSASEPLRGIETYPNICSSGVGGGEVCMRRKGHDGDHDPDSTEVRL